jgi:hypothetical protein
MDVIYQLVENVVYSLRLHAKDHDHQRMKCLEIYIHVKVSSHILQTINTIST